VGLSTLLPIDSIETSLGMQPCPSRRLERSLRVPQARHKAGVVS
jgi:hypothetical protein